jgi:hypothetical protein
VRRGGSFPFQHSLMRLLLRRVRCLLPLQVRLSHMLVGLRRRLLVRVELANGLMRRECASASASGEEEGDGSGASACACGE